MRHRVDHRKLGRVTEHRLALLRSLAQALIRHERIRTTLPKAKELRRFVERLVTTAKHGLAAGDGEAVRARRLVRRDLADPAVVKKLFDTIAPRFRERPGGYTRILRVGYRRGDNAELAQIEFVGSEYRPEAKAPRAAAEAAPAARGVGGRLKAAAARLRGKKEKAPPPEDEGASG